MGEDISFIRRVAAAGYGQPRTLPKKTEAKLRRLINLVERETVAALGGDWVKVEDGPPPDHESVLVWPHEVVAVHLTGFTAHAGTPSEVHYPTGYYEPAGVAPLSGVSHWRGHRAPTCTKENT